MSNAQSNTDPPSNESLAEGELRRFVLSIGDKGLIIPWGQSNKASDGSAKTSDDSAGHIEPVSHENDSIVAQLLDSFEQTTAAWPRQRLMLYAHGGNISEARATAWNKERLKGFLARGLYPIAFVWHTDFESQLRDLLLQLVSGGRGLGENLTRLNNRLVEASMHTLGSGVWSAIKDDAASASSSQSGAVHQFLTQLYARRVRYPNLELHVLGYSAGGIFQAYVVRLAAELSLSIESCVLWGPGCTTQLFKDSYMPLIEHGQIKRLALYTLLDSYEQLDTAALNYHGSVLIQVSKGLERVRDTPLVGLERHIEADPDLLHFLTCEARVQWVHAPQDGWSRATSHKEFDDDPDTLQSTMDVMLGLR